MSIDVDKGATASKVMTKFVSHKISWSSRYMDVEVLQGVSQHTT